MGVCQPGDETYFPGILELTKRSVVVDGLLLVKAVRAFLCMCKT
jgi:hypothetical protein